VIQPDGKILAAGSSTSQSSCCLGHVALARYSRDGRLDPSFGVRGTVHTSIGQSADNPVSGIGIQRDGKIVVVGQSSRGGRSPDVALARYLPDGRLDESFGAG
jgi:uncharacterized delta-60 repeat protein